MYVRVNQRMGLTAFQAHCQTKFSCQHQHNEFF